MSKGSTIEKMKKRPHVTPRRREQKWVLDALIAQTGIEVLFPGILPRHIENGYKYVDIVNTMRRIRCIDMFSVEWKKTAEKLESMAKQEERNGHHITAREFYHRSAVYFARSQWPIFIDGSKEKEYLYKKLIECYTKAFEHHFYRIERLEIPYEGRTVPGILHLPPGEGPFPCVLFIPGMDMVKEEFPNPFNNHFIKRGIAVLSVDGPGQGESNVRGIKVKLDSHQKVGQAAIDILGNRQEIDNNHIAVFGVSMGSYWALRIAAFDKRPKACVAAIGCYLQKDTIFNVAQPLFKINFMYMSGIDDEQEFDEMSAEMTMEGLENRISCPTLLATGQYDQLSPLEDAYKLFENLKCPKEMWVFENEFHSLGGVSTELFPWVADWIDDCFKRGVEPNLAKEKIIKQG